MSWEINQFATDPQLVEDLAVEIARHLQAAIASRDQATLAVSGGKTPLPLFARLSRSDIEWDKVTVTLVDERWVPEQHPDSNARLVKTGLLKGRARYARFLGLMTGAADPFTAEEQLDRRLGELPLPLDVVVLGMGEDGHTASYFPAARGVERAMDPQAERRCCAVEPSSAPHVRMTLSMPMILEARQIYLHIVGARKKQVLDQALMPDPVTGLPVVEQLPVAAVLHGSEKPVQIYYAEQGADL